MPQLAETQLTWGFPGDEPERIWVYVGDVEWSETGWATTRQQSEEFTLTVSASVLEPGGSAEDAERRAAGLFAVMGRVFLSNPTLGGLAVSTVLAPKKLASHPSPAGFIAQLDGGLRVTARIRRP